MIAVRLGAANIPEPTPFRKVSTAKIQYSKLTGMKSSAMKVTATNISPPVAKVRAPKRSDRMPEIGPETRNPTVSGNR